MDLVSAMQAVAASALPDAADMTTRLGTIDAAYSSGRPRVLFDGEASLTGITQTYPYVNSYTPVAGHRVLLLKSGSTWVILGCVDLVGSSVTFPSNRTDGTGKYYNNSNSMGTLSTFTYTASGSNGTGYYVPVYFAKATTIDRIGILVSVATGAVVHLARYTNSSAGEPGTRAINYGAIPSFSTSGAKELTVSDTIPAGVSWLFALAITSSSFDSVGITPAQQLPFAGRAGMVNSGMLSSFTTPTLTAPPASASSLTANYNVDAPAIWWRKA